MLRKNEGYFLADMLLSLAAFIMAASIVLPFVLMVNSQTGQIRKESAAIQILYDELMYIKIAGIESGRSVILKEGVNYKVTVYKDYLKTALEVCVHYDNEKATEKCGIIE